MTSKKNWTIRAAVLMFALVLITSCFVGGTFAKYVTSGTATDTARVAKFGVEIAAEGNVFAEAYDASATAKTVISSEEGKDVVAPGTKGSAAAVSVKGTPEVAVEVSYTLKTITLENWADKDGKFYCPLNFTVKHTAPAGEVDGEKTETIITVEGTKYDTAEDLVAALKEAVVGCTAKYDPNTDLSTVSGDLLTISWEWPFSTSADNDVKDTYLGDQAAAGNAATVSFELTATVTQID